MGIVTAFMLPGTSYFRKMCSYAVAPLLLALLSSRRAHRARICRRREASSKRRRSGGEGGGGGGDERRWVRSAIEQEGYHRGEEVGRGERLRETVSLLRPAEPLACVVVVVEVVVMVVV